MVLLVYLVPLTAENVMVYIASKFFTKLDRLIRAPSNDSPYQSSHLQQYNLNFDYGLNLSL